MAVAGGVGRLVHTVKVGTGGPRWLARWGCEVLKPQGGGVAYSTRIISCSFPHLEGCLKASLLLPVLPYAPRTLWPESAREGARGSERCSPFPQTLLSEPLSRDATRKCVQMAPPRCGGSLSAINPFHISKKAQPTSAPTCERRPQWPPELRSRCKRLSTPRSAPSIEPGSAFPGVRPEHLGQW